MQFITLKGKDMCTCAGYQTPRALKALCAGAAAGFGAMEDGRSLGALVFTVSGSEAKILSLLADSAFTAGELLEYMLERLDEVQAIEAVSARFADSPENALLHAACEALGFTFISTGEKLYAAAACEDDSPAAPGTQAILVPLSSLSKPSLRMAAAVPELFFGGDSHLLERGDLLPDASLACLNREGEIEGLSLVVEGPTLRSFGAHRLSGAQMHALFSATLRAMSREATPGSRLGFLAPNAAMMHILDVFLKNPEISSVLRAELRP